MPKKQAKILLVDIPYSAQESTLPLGLGCLAAYGKKSPGGAAEADWAIETYPRTSPPREIADAILRQRPQVVGLSVFLWNWKAVLEVARHIKNASPGTRVVLGGPQAHPEAARWVTECPAVDVVVSEEGEATFTEWVEAVLEGKTDWSSIAGLVYRRGKDVIATPPRPYIQDLDDIPSPYTDGTFSPHRIPRSVLLETSRGCPFDCKFCDWTLGKKMRYYSAGRVFDDFRFLLDKTTCLQFTDADFFLNKRLAKTLLRGFLELAGEREIFMSFFCNLTYLDDELIDLLGRESHRFELAVGVQSVDPEVLRRVTRGFNRAKVEHNRQGLWLKARRSYVQYGLIFGLPDDSLEKYRQSLEWGLSQRPDALMLHRALVLPGAPMGKQPDAYGLKKEDSQFAPVKSTPTFPEEDLARATELSVYVHVLNRLQGVGEALWQMGGWRSPEGGSPFLDVYGRFSEFLQAKGLGFLTATSLPDDRAPDTLWVSLAHDMIMRNPGEYWSILDHVDEFVGKQSLSPERTSALRATIEHARLWWLWKALWAAEPSAASSGLTASWFGPGVRPGGKTLVVGHGVFGLARELKKLTGAMPDVRELMPKVIRYLPEYYAFSPADFARIRFQSSPRIEIDGDGKTRYDHICLANYVPHAPEAERRALWDDLAGRLAEGGVLKTGYWLPGEGAQKTSDYLFHWNPWRYDPVSAEDLARETGAGSWRLADSRTFTAKGRWRGSAPRRYIVHDLTRSPLRAALRPRARPPRRDRDRTVLSDVGV